MGINEGGWIFLILPIVSLIFSWITVKRFKLAFLTVCPHFILLMIAIILKVYGLHSFYAKELVQIVPNLFNFVVWILGAVWGRMIYLIIKNVDVTNKRSLINSIGFFAMYIINFVLIEFVFCTSI